MLYIGGVVDDDAHIRQRGDIGYRVAKNVQLDQIIALGQRIHPVDVVVIEDDPV